MGDLSLSCQLCVETEPFVTFKMVKRKAIIISDDTASAKQTSLLQMYKRRKGMKRSLWRSKGIYNAKKLIPKILKDPFPPTFRTKLSWSPPTYLLAPGTTNGAIVIRVNDLYDPDVSNVLGNGQALFTDQMCSATGPYVAFYVNSWKCKFELCNASAAGGGSAGDLALDGYLVQGCTSSTDVDTFAELAALPGRQTFLLGPRSGAPMKTLYINGSQKAITPNSRDADHSGAYNASPAKPIYVALGLKNAYTTDTGTIQCYIKVSVEFDVTFMQRDAVDS